MKGNGKAKVAALNIPYELEDSDKKTLAYLFDFIDTPPEDTKSRQNILSSGFITPQTINQIYWNKDYRKHLYSQSPFTKTLEKLTEDFYHYGWIDSLLEEAYKQNPTSPLFTSKDIRNLREERRQIIQENHPLFKTPIDLTIFDYSPYFFDSKRTVFQDKNGKTVYLIYFVCYKEDIFNSFSDENFATSLIISGIQTAPTQDVKDHIFDGSTSIAFVTFNKKIWMSIMHLAEKYENLTLDQAWKQIIKMRKHFEGDIKDTFDFQNALTGLYSGAITYDSAKGAAPAWLKNYIQWHIKDSNKGDYVSVATWQNPEAPSRKSFRHPPDKAELMDGETPETVPREYIEGDILNTKGRARRRFK